MPRIATTALTSALDSVASVNRVRNRRSPATVSGHGSSRAHARASSSRAATPAEIPRASSRGSSVFRYTEATLIHGPCSGCCDVSAKYAARHSFTNALQSSPGRSPPSASAAARRMVEWKSVAVPCTSNSSACTLNTLTAED